MLSRVTLGGRRNPLLVIYVLVGHRLKAARWAGSRVIFRFKGNDQHYCFLLYIVFFGILFE